MLVYYSSRFRLLPLCVALSLASQSYAEDSVGSDMDASKADSGRFVSTLPTLVAEAQSEQAQTQGYTLYEEPSIVRTGATAKETPQTIETLNIQKNKNYGTNDLSSIVEGNAGIDAAYDMRGESIFIRGFAADASDIYRDGVRSSGQVRRSTANVERVEILKGPASVLYGRSGGGGVINLVSKKANFTPRTSVNLRTGSWDRVGGSFDSNQVINDNWAVRLTTDYEKGNNQRSTVEYKNKMISPSVLYQADDGKWSWEGQYTYDNAWRVPDRNPNWIQYDKMGIDYDVGFAHDGDEVRDVLHFARSNLHYELSPNWAMDWTLGYRQASQDFDHTYAGTFDEKTKKLSQNYAWQETNNKTLSNSLLFKGTATTGKLDHQITAGYDFSKEDRTPKLFFKSNYFAIDPYDPASWPINTHHLENATTDKHYKATNHGIFVQDLISVTPDLKVSLGGRYDRFKFSGKNLLKDTENSYSKGVFSPNAGIVWNFLPDHTAYASYSKSFAPYGGSGYLNINPDEDPNTFNTDPQHNRQYEIGVKSDWLDGRLSTTAALYEVSHYNTRYHPDRNNPYRWEVRGKDRSRGIDLSMIGQIKDDWYVRGSLGLMSAKILENKQNPDQEGRHLRNTSKMQGNFFVRYVPNPTWYGEVGVTHSGKRYGNPNQNDKERIDLPGFTRFDALLGYQYNKQISGTFAIQNLFNKKYWRSDSKQGDERSFMAKINYEF